MKKSKILAMFLAAGMILSMTACSDSKSSSSSDSSSSSSNSDSSSAADNKSSESQADSAASSDAGSSAESPAADGNSENGAAANSEAEVKLTGTLTPVGKDTGIGIQLPEGYSLNEGWSCYSDKDFKNAVWVQDTQVYETEAAVLDAMGNTEDKGFVEENIGGYMVFMVEEADGFYGASTNYYVQFNAPIGKYAGMRILVSNSDKDLAQTQSEAIKAMIASIEPMQ